MLLNLKIFFFFLQVGTISGHRPRVTINDGTLLGIPMETWLGRKIYAFRKIPFAAPPVGALRFQAPQPVHPWNHTRDAGLMAPRCPQVFLNTYNLNEDCLYLNVYSPQLPTKSVPISFPVLVYIHGGAFTVLSGSDYGPRYLLDYDIVFVTINYRLGALGFLSTQDGVVPGNNGLKDQVAALRWIQQNIAAFGGNPNEVTIGGTSTGAASVQYHFLSRLSRGLFKRGICMSGSTFMPSAYMKAPLLKLQFLASQVGCPLNSSTAIVECLMTTPVLEIINVQGMLTNYFYFTPPLPFGPIIERGSVNPFITRYPYQILRTGDVQPGPILFSVVTGEGLYPAAAILDNTTGLNALNKDFLQYAPILMDYIFTVTHREMNATSKKIREYYFGNQMITVELNQTIIQMIGDRQITDNVETAARIHSYVQPAPIYFYQFGYRGQYSLITLLLSGTNINWGVAGHADETVYIFNATYIQPSENTPSDREMIRVMSSLWANFAINGYPSVGTEPWPPLERSNAMNGPVNFMYIASPTNFIPNSTLQFGHPTFWNNLPLNEPMSGRPARDFI